jgi:hypothetical protein
VRKSFGDDVRLSATSAQRLVAKNRLRVRDDVRGRHKEPFTLADEGTVVPTEALALIETGGVRGIANLHRLQSELCLRDTRSATRHRGDEPLALVVSTQEAIFRFRRLHEQE